MLFDPKVSEELRNRVIQGDTFCFASDMGYTTIHPDALRLIPPDKDLPLLYLSDYDKEKGRPDDICIVCPVPAPHEEILEGMVSVRIVEIKESDSGLEPDQVIQVNNQNLFRESIGPRVHTLVRPDPE